MSIPYPPHPTALASSTSSLAASKFSIAASTLPFDLESSINVDSNIDIILSKVPYKPFHTYYDCLASAGTSPSTNASTHFINLTTIRRIFTKTTAFLSSVFIPSLFLILVLSNSRWFYYLAPLPATIFCEFLTIVFIDVEDYECTEAWMMKILHPAVGILVNDSRRKRLGMRMEVCVDPVGMDLTGRDLKKGSGDLGRRVKASLMGGSVLYLVCVYAMFWLGGLGWMAYWVVLSVIRGV